MAFSLLAHAAGEGTAGPIDTTGSALIVLSTGQSLFSIPFAPTDSYGNHWTLRSSHGGSYYSQEWECIAPICGPGHTATLSGGTINVFPAIGMSAWSASGIVSFGAQNGKNQSVANTLQTGAVAPPAANALFVSTVTGNQAGHITSIDSSFAILDSVIPLLGGSVSLSHAWLIGSASENPIWTGNQLVAGCICVWIETAPPTPQVTLSLASGVGAPGDTIPLALSIFSTGGLAPVAVEWTFLLTPDLTLVSVALGASGTAASKTLSRSGGLCVVWGVNTNVISDGVLAILTVQVVLHPSTTSIPVGVLSVLASDADANPLATGGIGGIVTVPILTIACPVSGIARQNESYSGTLLPGGTFTNPLAYAIIGGMLPPGLSLDPSTGVISGTPTTPGNFPYTAQVTDANGQTAQVTCQISVPPIPVAVPGHHTLRWQIEAPNRAGRWFAHQYADQVVAHYLTEPSASDPNDQELLLLGPEIWISGGNVDNDTAIQSLAMISPADGGDERAQKLYPDAMIQLDGVGQVLVTPTFQSAQVNAPTTPVTAANGVQQVLVNIASLSNLALYRNIGAVLSWTGGPDGPRIYAWEPAWYAQPYLSTFLVTQFLNLSYPGWKSHRRLYPALISTAVVTFTIKCQDGRTFIYDIPSTNGQLFILPMMVNHALKDLAFAYQLDGHGVPFALFPDEFTIESKGWADPEFLDLAIFKT